MPWTLSTESQQSYPAPPGEALYVVAGDAGLTAARVASNASLILGTLVVHSYGAKLEAGSEDLRVVPAGSTPAKLHPNGDGDGPSEELVLRAKTDQRVETMILRDQDRILSVNTPGSLTLIWTPPQVQVHSSEKKGQSEVAELEAETEEDEDDEEDLDNTIVRGVSKSQTRSTPHLSDAHSEVIQETPTVNRIDATAFPTRKGHPELSKETSTATAVVYSTAPNQQSIVNDLSLSDGASEAEKSETPVTAPRRSRLTKVDIPKSNSAAKRPSPEMETPNSPSPRTSKRRKVDNTEADATPAQPVRKTAPKNKKQPAIKAEPTPSRSQSSTPTSSANSGKSAAAAVDSGYDGPKPRVALSNSSIQPNGPFSKFLKKHGGSIVEAVEGDCNILCVKDGPILKTPKLLQAVAHGIPVVIDKWLLDSGKATHLLPLDAYIPPDLAAVWKIPQDRLLKGYTIYFTPTLKAHYKSAFTDMEQLCKAVGARRVVSKKPGGKDFDAKMIYLAEAKGDPDVPALLESGHTCYSKDFLTHSIIVGDVDLGSDEFKVQAEEEKSAKKKGRARNG
ncbi:hypothetical protein BU23DRAFT_599621 [Bimuria novae-zelandiae CBS 107.79]|uniref:BRCT domain-containing protein n=1 Tax=Bimuria novae-zelandiae CBS 107.79 TaxID=1447943 RepID=A0A6A5V626_9PLEO|nr:hypothetical protein BU23DRAFT_599621 [Bimuria novae-zelandiae CBS 107.79]